MRMASRSDKSVFPWARKNRRWQRLSNIATQKRGQFKFIMSSILEVVIVMWFKTGLISFTSFCTVWAPNYSSRGVWSRQMLFRRFALVISSATGLSLSCSEARMNSIWRRWKFSDKFTMISMTMERKGVFVLTYYCDLLWPFLLTVRFRRRKN